MFVARASEARESCSRNRITLSALHSFAILARDAIMEPTYTILGPDGKQYGPVTAEQFRAWAREGRVGGQTQVWRSDTTEWCAASALPELGVAAPAVQAIPAPIPASTVSEDPDLEKRVKNGASWLYTFAVFSLINSIAALAGASWRFVIGLGVTQLIDDLAAHLGSSGKIVAFGLDLAVTGVLLALGIFAAKKHLWAPVIGTVLLGLDAALVGLAALGSGEMWTWVNLAVHAWAIFVMFRGFQASRAARG